MQLKHNLSVGAATRLAVESGSFFTTAAMLLWQFL